MVGYGRFCLLATLATAVVGQAAEPPIDTPRVSFDISSRPVPEAIKAIGIQSGLAVIVYTDLARGVVAPAIIGSYTPAQAFERVLAPTRLHAEYLDKNTVAVMGDLPDQAAGWPNGRSEGQGAQSGSRLWERFRPGQVDQGAPAGSSSIGGSDREASDQNSAKLEEVIVTAQKREERLIDVPISIVALSSEELQQRALTSLDDLQFAVPGMAVQADGLGNRIELRGISNLTGVSPLVGVYIDEADVTNSSGVQINPNTYDLERVEVLRGPQGTLYGEGSAGGTVRFITRNPVLDRFGMTADVAALFTQDGAPGQRVNTAVNVPLIEDQLGLRMVGTFDREGGWIDQPAAGRKDINGQDLTNVRIKGLWRPTPQLTVTAMVELYRNDRSSGSADDARGNFTQVFNLTTTPRVSEDHDLYNFTLTYNFSSVRILSTTSYLRETVEARDFGYSYLPSPPGTAPANFLNPYTLSNDHASIEELRLSSIGSGPWQWTVGGFYRHYRDLYDQPSGYSGLLGPPGTPLPASYGSYLSDTLFKSWSVFGDINYTLSDRFTLGAGVRSFHEQQDYLQISDFGVPATTGQTGKFHSVDPRVYAQYKLTPNSNIYASAAKGFRSGGFNPLPTQPTFAPESVRTYELGTKMLSLNGRLRADTAVFYTKYADYVINGLTSLTGIFPAYVNAGNARIEGVEWDFTWQPVADWSLRLNGDYLDGRFTEINATSTAYAVGDPLDLVPKYQVTASGQHDFSWNGKRGFMRLDYTRRGRETYRNRAIPGWYSETDVNNLLGYYMNLQWNESLSLNLFAQNLLNDRGLITPESGASVRSRPRTYGLGFTVSF